MTHTQAALNPDFKKEGDGKAGDGEVTREGHGKAGDREVAREEHGKADNGEVARENTLSTGFVLWI